ncbi:MAG TPA: Bax inhibitor-1/YccA family protein [Xanthobacteraceae bacterium]|jgi:FtsH-binding integral membrane protein
MSEYNPNPAARYGTTVARDRVAVDEGLRAYMLRVYNYMTVGLAITGAVALGTFMAAVAVDPATGARALTQIGQLLYASPLKWVVIFAPLALVFFLSFRIDRLSVGAAQALFWVYAALVGLSLSVIFLVFTGQSITRVFFITAASFGALSLYGYTTKTDLSPMRSFLLMGVIGLLIAMVVNIFLVSSMLQWIISVVGVLVFAGLTAYDTQQIKEMYYVADDGTVAGRKAVMGALRLYLDFLNMFMFLLQLFGNRQE